MKLKRTVRMPPLSKLIVKLLRLLLFAVLFQDTVVDASRLDKQKGKKTEYVMFGRRIQNGLEGVKVVIVCIVTAVRYHNHILRLASPVFSFQSTCFEEKSTVN